MMSMVRNSRFLRGVVALFSVLLLSVFGGASPASAHVDQTGSSPVPGEVLTAFPATMSVTFGEDVFAVFVSMEVLRGTAAAPGEAIATLDRITTDPSTTVEFKLPPTVATPKETGEYVGHWRYYGLDGHVMEGYVPFSVGPPAGPGSGTPTTDPPASGTPSTTVASSTAPSPTTPSPGYGSPDSLSVLYPALRAGARFFAFLAASMLFGVFFWSRQKMNVALKKEIAPVWQLSRAFAGSVLALSAAVVAFASVMAARDAGVTAKHALASLVFSQGVFVWLLVIVFAFVATKELWAVPPAVLLVALASALSSHAAALDLAWVSVLFSSLHIVALVVWAGPLFALGYLRAAQGGFRAHPALPRLLADGLERFSIWAATAIAVLVISGTRQAIAMSEGVPYGVWGRYLMVKLFIAALCVAPFGVFHHLAIKRAREGGAPWPVLRKTVWLECAGVSVVMLVGAVLAATAH
jgi:putative copper export protein/methionine-rich copper-binding protein CopC